MGRIVSNFFISLDGVVESPDQWHFPYFDDAMGEIVGEGMASTGAFLMGRKLYDEWSAYWPEQGPEVPFSEFINTIPKYVLSTTFKDPSGRTRRSSPATSPLGSRAQGQHRGRHRDVGQRDHRALAARQRAARRAGPARAPDRRRVGPAAVRGHPHQPLTLLHSAALDSGVFHLRYAPASA